MRVHIVVLEYAASIGIWFIDEKSGKYLVAKPMILEWEEQDGDAFKLPEPSLTIPHHLKDDFMQAFAEALSSKGIATANQHNLEGALEAKNAHLKDLRELLFSQSHEVKRKT